MQQAKQRPQADSEQIKEKTEAETLRATGASKHARMTSILAAALSSCSTCGAVIDRGSAQEAQSEH